MHRTVPSRRIRTSLNVFHRRRAQASHTSPAHRARTRDTGPAHVSANLIYFGPDKKLIYRKARRSWETTIFFRALGREPEVTRRISRGANRVTMRSRRGKNLGEGSGLSKADEN